MNVRCYLSWELLHLFSFELCFVKLKRSFAMLSLTNFISIVAKGNFQTLTYPLILLKALQSRGRRERGRETALICVVKPKIKIELALFNV